MAPTTLFEDLRERPRWWLPFVIFLVGAALVAILPRLLLPTDVLLDAIRQNLPGPVEMPGEEMIQRMQSPVMLVFSGLGGALFAGVSMVLTALFFWALFSITGEKCSFSKSFAVVSYSGLIKVLGMALVVVLMVILQKREVYTSLALLPFLEQGTFLYRLAAQIDFFTVWRVIIMGLGFSVVADVPKVKSYLSVIIPWILLSLGMAALRFGFPR